MRFEQVEGKRAVLEALRGSRSVAELLVGEGMKSEARWMRSSPLPAKRRFR